MFKRFMMAMYHMADPTPSPFTVCKNCNTTSPGSLGTCPNCGSTNVRVSK